MKMRKDGRGPLRKYGTGRRRGRGSLPDDMDFRKKSRVPGEWTRHKKPPRLKPGRYAAAKYGKWKARASSFGWRGSGTYRMVMSGDLREIEKVLTREEARYFRHLTRSQRKKLLRKVEQRVAGMMGVPDWKPERGRMAAALPVQRAGGGRKTAVFIAAGPGPQITEGSAGREGRTFFEGPSLEPDGTGSLLEGLPLEPGQEGYFLEAASPERDQEDDSLRREAGAPGDPCDTFKVSQGIANEKPAGGSLPGSVAIGTGFLNARASSQPGNVPFAAHFQEMQGRNGAFPDLSWEPDAETGADHETMTGRRFEKKRNAQVEKRRKEELKKEISRRRDREAGKRRASKAGFFRRAYDAGAHFMFGVRKASLSGKEREDAERNARNYRALRQGTRYTKRTARITARLMRLLTRFAVFAAPVLLPFFLALFIVLLFSHNTRVQSEYLTGTAAEIYAYLRASDPESMGDIQIAAILGNMYAESGLSPDAIEGGFGEGGPWTAEDFPTIHYDGTSYEEAGVNPYAYRGYGLLMWAGERANALQARADNGAGEDAGEDRWNNLRVQLGLLAEEMGDPSMWGAGEYTRDDFYNAEDVETAVRAFHSSFLMRGGTGPENLTLVEEVRIPKALEYYRRMLTRSFDYAGNFGEMDAYGAMSIPWFRMDVGLFDPDTRTWSHQEETGVIIVPGHPVSMNGCGICSAAMALSYCTGRMIYPSEIISNPSFIHNSIGEYQMGCSEALAESFGVRIKYSDDRAEVTAALEGGCPVMILVQGMAPNNRITPGHYFLLTGYDASGDHYILTDPGGAGLGDPNCLTYVDQSNLVPGRSYVPSPYGTLYRQTFTWEELTSHKAGSFVIYGVG